MSSSGTCTTTAFHRSGRCGVELTPLVHRLRTCLLGHTVLHADETPVPMLSPGKKKTHRACIWAYATTQTTPIQGVVYDFQPTRSGQASRDFLADWQGKLVCDDYQGYKAGFAGGITEAACRAHARRKFFELSERGDSPIADRALQMIGLLYDIERSGHITREMENAYLAFDPGEEAPIHGLLGASVTYRIATGPREGQKVFTLPMEGNMCGDLRRQASAAGHV